MKRIIVIMSLCYSRWSQLRVHLFGVLFCVFGPTVYFYKIDRHAVDIGLP